MNLLIYGHKINDKEELTYVLSLINYARDAGMGLVFYRPYLKELQKYSFDITGFIFVDTYRELNDKKKGSMKNNVDWRGRQSTEVAFALFTKLPRV